MKEIIAGLGEILWDVLPTGKILGGAPANFAYHISQFGFNGYAVSAVGNDDLGNEILDNLNQKKLNYCIEKTNFPTGTVQVTLDEKGIPNYEICEDVAWDNIPFSKAIEDLAKNTKTVCFGSLAQRNPVSRQTINLFLENMPNDSLKIFDINLRQHFYSMPLIEDALRKCDLLKINDEEVETVANLLGWNGKSELDICRQLLEMYGLKMVVLTRGSEDSYVLSSTEVSHKLTPHVPVVDTVGAGDSFTAAFVAGILSGKSISEAHQLAVDVSAYVCTQPGAMPVLPEDLRNRLQ